MAKPNGYMLYLSDRRNADRRNGRPIQSDSDYGAEWANLSAEEKRRYKEKAQGRNTAANGHVASAPAGALSADSVTGDFMDVESENTADKEITEMVESLVGQGKEAASAVKLVIGSSNVIVKTTDGRFFPQEIGLVKYSLTQGVIGKYQQFTDPGPVPQGYMFKALNHINETHHIPENFDRAIGRQSKQNDFENMMDEISIFVSESQFQFKGKTCILIFTKDDMVEQLSGSFLFYLNESNHTQMLRMWNEQRLRVVDISFLICGLYATAGIQMALPLCADIPNMSSFDWTPGSCEWHTEQDNNHCAQGVCMRWCYLMSDCLLPAYDIEPIAGQHLPLIDQSGIHVEEAADDEVWNVSRDVGRRSGRPFMSSVNGDKARTAPPAAASVAGTTSETRAAETDPRLREFEPPGVRRPDPRNAVGRGFRRN